MSFSDIGIKSARICRNGLSLPNFSGKICWLSLLSSTVSIKAIEGLTCLALDSEGVLVVIELKLMQVAHLQINKRFDMLLFARRSLWKTLSSYSRGICTGSTEEEAICKDLRVSWNWMTPRIEQQTSNHSCSGPGGSRINTAAFYGYRSLAIRSRRDYRDCLLNHTSF